MSLTKGMVIENIGSALNSILDARATPQIDAPNADTPLFGENGNLDSMELVMLIMDVEQWVNDNQSSTLVVADAKAMSRSNSPFRNIGSMADFILGKLTEKRDDA